MMEFDERLYKRILYYRYISNRLKECDKRVHIDRQCDKRECHGIGNGVEGLYIGLGFAGTSSVTNTLVMDELSLTSARLGRMGGVE